jgi:hypothetical protein
MQINILRALQPILSRKKSIFAYPIIVIFFSLSSAFVLKKQKKRTKKQKILSYFSIP